MDINDLFVRPPLAYDIPNLGVAKIGMPNTQQEWDVLDFELRNFVCEGEYRRGLERVFETFVTNLNKPQQPAAWVSGFYGSGKSHFVKVLESLWRDTKLPGGATARGLVPLTADISEKLVELKTLGERHGGLWAAAGKLGSSAGSMRLALLAIVLRSADLPEEYAKARFVLYFQQLGKLDDLKAALNARGSSLDEALLYMTLSDELAESILDVQPAFASSITEVKTRLENTFPIPEDISTNELLDTLVQVLKTKSTRSDRLPLTLLVFDELQQFMGGDPEKADELLNVVEDISSRLESRVLFVATGQSEMGATAELQKLQDRFKVRVTLGVTDVEAVVRRVILAKKPEMVSRVEAAVDGVLGEIDRQLAGSAIAPTAADAKDLALDYPLLPARRRFWDRVLRGFDNMGRAGQLRTQLRVVHEAVKQVADKPLGWVVPADAIFDQLRPDLLQTGALLREVASTIDDLATEQPDGALSSRLCQLVFLIGKVPTEGLFADPGIRPTAATLADLLVEDLNAGGAALRQKVPLVLESLAKRGILLFALGEEYRLQTKKGAEWQQAYQAHLIACKADLPRLRDARVDEFKKAIETARKDVKVNQGVSKEPRRTTLHFGDQPPPTSAGDIPVWVRDEWSETEKRVRDETRSYGVDSAVVSIFLPRRNADALVETIASLHAREETLSRPAPTTDAGKEARASMQTQAQRDRERLDDLVDAVLKDTLVLQGGGTEATGAGFADKLSTAAAASVIRLFPKFDLADNPKWGEILPFIKTGNGDPLQKVGFNGDPQDHPVCKEVLAFIANGSEKGSGVRAHFIASPFGWPRDAIDGALMALVAAGRLIAKRNSQQVEAKSFDTNTIGGADFERESNVVTLDQKLALRALAKDILGLNVKAGEEVDAVRRLLDEVKLLAHDAGGEAPLPARTDTDEVDRLRQSVGNKQLLETYSACDEMRKLHTEWTRRKQLAAERVPGWERVNAMARHAAALPIAAEVAPAISAIRDQRLLLEGSDPTNDVRQKLATALRAAITDAHAALASARASALATLDATTEWPKLTPGQQDVILRDNQLTPTPAPDVSGDEQVTATLERVSLAEWADKLAAIPGRLDNARRQAAMLLEPKSIVLTLPKRTITSVADLDRFLADLRALIEPRIGEGPIII
jgi:hypothetical protein